ncbi:hypothetical protein [Bacteroides heparinolyticus]
MCRGKKIAGVLDRHLHLTGQTQAFEPTDTSVQADSHKPLSSQTQVPDKS